MSSQYSATRILIAVLIALLGSVIVWCVVPYNNFYLDNTYISDSYLPEIVIALLLVLILGINPLLRLLGTKYLLDRSQLALIAGLLLFAAIVPSNGLMRMFPRFVAEINQGFHSNVTTARIAAEADFRPELFPDPLPRLGENGEVITTETPVSTQFLEELDLGASIPWDAWMVPLAMWGVLIFAMWMMMLGLGGVVFPHWRERERLPFPLLNVYHALTGSGDEGADKQRTLPKIFYSKVFWIAVISVFTIHLFRGLHVFTGAFPSFPLEWNLSEYFQDGILRSAPGTFKRQAIFFALVGVAYFVPNRYSVSIWGWVVGYGIYMWMGTEYVPAFEVGQVSGQAFGMMIAIIVWVIWLGRSHWYLVGRAMFGQTPKSAESRRDSIAGWMFVLGFAGMAAWLAWAGSPIWFCLLATIGTAMISLLMARIIAETGLPILWMGRVTIGSLLAFFPLTWQSPAVLLFSGVLYATVSRASAVSAIVMTTLAMGMDKEATAKRQGNMLLGGLVVLVIGFVVCSAVHLNMGYQSSEISTDPKTSARSINDWDRATASNYTFTFWTGSRFDQVTGFTVGSGLLWACSRFPSWPVHPVGILFVRNSIGNLIWFSIFLGWLIKVMTTRLFGGGAYRAARPVFIGLILGELLALIVWAIVPSVLVWWTGQDPSEIVRYTLIKYP